MSQQTSKAPVATDARKLRSRKALFDAFLNLLEGKNIEQISIREIAAAAGIGHATFYRHYATKEALLDDLAADEIRRLVGLTLPIMNSKNTRAACAELCRHVIEKKSLWSTLLTGGAAGAVKAELLTISREIAANNVYVSRNTDMIELKVTLSVTAIVETLAWWLRQKNPVPLECVADSLDIIITSHEKLGSG